MNNEDIGSSHALEIRYRNGTHTSLLGTAEHGGYMQAIDVARQRVVDRAERAVAEAASRNGAKLVKHVLLDLEHRLEHYSFLLIDRYGVAGITVQGLPSVRVTGGSGKPQWRGLREGDKPFKLENPLDARNRRINTLQSVLAACGRSMAPEYVTDLAILAGADLSSVQLTPIERMVVIGSDEIGSMIDARYDFPPNAGLLDPGEINDLESLFYTLNRSDDADALARAEQHAAPKTNLLNRITGAKDLPAPTVAISDSAAGVAPVAVRLAERRYPGGLGAPAAKRRTSPLTMAALVALVGVAVWMYAFDGYWTTVGWMAGLTSAQASQPVASAPSNDAGLQNAQRVLEETDPILYANVVNLDTPLMNRADEYQLFTWDYVSPDGGRGTITLTFDSSGMLRGANRQ